jgi:hypothetical protein
MEFWEKPILKKDAACYSETLDIIYKTSRLLNPDNRNKSSAPWRRQNSYLVSAKNIINLSCNSKLIARSLGVG